MSGSVLKLLDMKGRTSLITGATGYCGRAIINALSELGSDVILVDHPNTQLIDFANEISEKFQNVATPFFCDLEKSHEIDKFLLELKNRFNSLDVLINNAAFVGSNDLEGWSTSLEDQSLETWKRALDVNLTACFQIMKSTRTLLNKSSCASIINIGSIYGLYAPDLSIYEKTGMNNPAAYSASKGGLLQLSRWMSTVLAPNIRVNSISPGGLKRNQPENFIDRYVKKTPLKRMGSESDVVGAVVYLASDLSSWVTGQNLIVDGGWGVW